MPSLSVLPDHQTVPIIDGQTILQATLAHCIPHVHACGGQAKCSTCRVVVTEGLAHCDPRTAAEQTLADKLHLTPYMRLACQTTVHGDVALRRPVVDALDLELTRQAVEAPGQRLGEEKQLAILFTDIENYTPFAEALPPYDIIHVLNRYFRLMSDVVSQRHGYIVDYVGDGLLVLFGLERPEQAVADALAAVQGMFQAMARLNPYLEQMYGRGFRVRAGLHYGPVVVGHIGQGDSRKLAAIGDSVNMASRIESTNKDLGTQFLVSEAVVKAAGPSLLTHRNCERTLKGKTGQYQLYEVLPEALPPVTP
ncbi:adenylate/guanylate cyclase domain-containing protein [Hymenobacter negativus]|uniref:Adenylate/guanylate cyclase domain-containing protein n=1 Tax=Hymenobacter negativus TaxID=2795026 RepID=A0ABS3QCB1_9BACT|nr:adenylate/guanylate cyclase domain-containing protein [Hymenobacter negativus]MBO2008879.1 adenylate/guanylate cyclase domain-containing protein [Hymenobacter negativus]